MVLIEPFEPKALCNGILLHKYNIILTHSLCATRSWVSGYANKVTIKITQLKYIKLFCPCDATANVALWFFDKSQDIFKPDIFTPVQIIDTPLTDFYNMATHLTLILDGKNHTKNATEIPIQVYNYETGELFAPVT